MPRRIGPERPTVARKSGAPVLGIAVIAFAPAIAGPPAISGAALPYVVVLVYSFNLIVLIVFGIWGFRLGTGWRDDGNGGGSKGPDVEPPPPGGLEATDDFPAWEDQFTGPEPEAAQADRLDKISQGTP